MTKKTYMQNREQENGKWKLPDQLTPDRETLPLYPTHESSPTEC